MGIVRITVRQTCCIVPALVALAIFSGCGPLRIRTPVPEALQDEAQIPGYADIRYWGDRLSPRLQADLVALFRHIAERNARDPSGQDPAGHGILALSGGGSDGAFGAGFLCGWTAHGDRPRFRIVTGISTGALIAPFAFLGPEYDQKLKEVYTTVEADNIMFIGGLLDVLGRVIRGDSISDTTPLVKLVARYIDQAMLEKIAAEHRMGRRLYVGTTNLDAQRPVIWDLGAIAASGRPDALDLFHNVLIASAAIPVAFPPMYINVEAGGKRYDEMHVDGGVTTEVFAYGSIVDCRAAARAAGLKSTPGISVFIIRNSPMRPEQEEVPPRVAPITTRAISTLIKYQADGDIYRIFAIAQRDNMDFNLAFIPDGFHRNTTEEFNKAEMNRLFDVGYILGKAGYRWQKVPRNYEPAAAATQPASP